MQVEVKVYHIVSPTPTVGMVKGKLVRGQSWVTSAKEAGYKDSATIPDS